MFAGAGISTTIASQGGAARQPLLSLTSEVVGTFIGGVSRSSSLAVDAELAATLSSARIVYAEPLTANLDLSPTFFANRHEGAIEFVSELETTLNFIGGAGGIKVSRNGTVVNSNTNEIDFRGAEIGVTQAGGTALVYVPPLSFDPSLSLSVNGGDFNGTSVVEKGATLSAFNLTWASNDTLNAPITAASVSLGASFISMDAGSSTTTGGIYTPPSPAAEPVSFTVAFTSTAGSASRSAAISFRYRSYWGFTDAASPTEADIEALTSNNLLSNTASSYALSRGTTTQQYLVVAVPSTFSSISTFRDASTGFEVPFNAPTTVSVTNAYGSTTNYSVYRSTNQTATSAITLQVS